MNKSGEGSFVFYESFLDTIEQAKKCNMGLEMIEAILNYGLYHEESNDPIIQMGMAQIKNDIDRAQLRHQESIDTGSTGGRPQKEKIDIGELVAYLASGHTQAEAAKQWGVSTRTIQRRLEKAKDLVPRIGGGSPTEDGVVPQAPMELAASGFAGPSTGTWKF